MVFLQITQNSNTSYAIRDTCHLFVYCDMAYFKTAKVKKFHFLFKGQEIKQRSVFLITNKFH